MNEKPIVTVLGGGNGAFAAAADLTLKGFEVRLLEAPHYKGTIEPVLDRGGIELINESVPDFKAGFAHVQLVTTDPMDAMDSTDILLYIVPGFAESAFTELIMPYLEPDQLVIFFCGVFGGALEFASTLRSEGMNPLPLIGETEALIYGALKSNPTTVRVTGRKQALAVSGLPASRTDEILGLIRSIVPDVTWAKNVIETGLRNANIILHPPVSILNAGRMNPEADPFRFYWDGVTAPVGRVVEGLDLERILVGEALGLSLSPTRSRLLEWYGTQGASGETLGEIMATNPPYEAAMAPQTLFHRFIIEDIPFGLVPMEEFGHSLNIPTPIASSLITLSNELLGRDLRKEGRNMQRLGIAGLSPQELKAMINGHVS